MQYGHNTCDNSGLSLQPASLRGWLAAFGSHHIHPFCYHKVSPLLVHNDITCNHSGHWAFFHAGLPLDHGCNRLFFTHVFWTSKYFEKWKEFTLDCGWKILRIRWNIPRHEPISYLRSLYSSSEYFALFPGFTDQYYWEFSDGKLRRKMWEKSNLVTP